MRLATARRRRIAGWTCIAFGKVGSLWLAWIVLTGMPGTTPLALLAAVVAGVSLGLWLLTRVDE
jgi:hypothetical protein